MSVRTVTQTLSPPETIFGAPGAIAAFYQFWEVAFVENDDVDTSGSLKDMHPVKANVRVAANWGNLPLATTAQGFSGDFVVSYGRASPVDSPPAVAHRDAGPLIALYNGTATFPPRNRGAQRPTRSIYPFDWGTQNVGMAPNDYSILAELLYIWTTSTPG